MFSMKEAQEVVGFVGREYTTGTKVKAPSLSSEVR